jgi:antitoxin component of RelBE/YafQ-DinJ toxin-antitoxin module
MSLERKDVRLKLDHDIHAAAKAIAETEGMEIAEWIEVVINGVVKRRVHQATLVVERLTASGSLGTFRDDAGTK